MSTNSEFGTDEKYSNVRISALSPRPFSVKRCDFESHDEFVETSDRFDKLDDFLKSEIGLGPLSLHISSADV